MENAGNGQLSVSETAHLRKGSEGQGQRPSNTIRPNSPWQGNDFGIEDWERQWGRGV
jgi:hypothetical protein